MTTATPSRVLDTQDGKQGPSQFRRPLASKIEDLALQERDAIRRRDWSGARANAEMRVALQAVRQQVLAKKLK